jgi:hypothetical protein
MAVARYRFSEPTLYRRRRRLAVGEVAPRLKSFSVGYTDR